MLFFKILNVARCRNLAIKRLVTLSLFWLVTAQQTLQLPPTQRSSNIYAVGMWWFSGIYSPVERRWEKTGPAVAPPINICMECSLHFKLCCRKRSFSKLSVEEGAFGSMQVELKKRQYLRCFAVKMYKIFLVICAFIASCRWIMVSQEFSCSEFFSNSK